MFSLSALSTLKEWYSLRGFVQRGIQQSLTGLLICTTLVGCRSWLLPSTERQQITPTIERLELSSLNQSACSDMAAGGRNLAVSSEALLSNLSSSPCLYTPAWWIVFADPQLNQWIDQALQDSFRLSAADARLEQIAADLQQRQKIRLPILDIAASTAEERTSMGSSDKISSSISTAYEVDIWGRISLQRDVAEQQFELSLAERQGLQQTVAAEVIKAWYGLAKESQKLQLLSQQQARTEAALTVIQRRYDLGQGRASDIWQQQQLVNGVLAEKIQSEARWQGFYQQLQRWTGRPNISEPSRLRMAEYWQDIKIDPNTGASSVGSSINTDSSIAAEQLQLRPDIQQSWTRIQLSDAQLAQAISERFPKLSISASYSSQATRFESLFDNWLSNIAANIALPVLDVGRRKVAVTQARAVRQAAVADYQQAWLEATLEVEDALVNRQQFRSLLANTENSLLLAQRTEEFLSRRYRRGATDFLSLLRAQQDVLTLEARRLETRWSLLQVVVQLYKSLGSLDQRELASSADL